MNIPELPLGWLPLADVVAKTTVILLAAAVASVVLRRASAALRHLVWTLALSSALVLPIASFALPKWQLSLVTISAPAAAVEAAHDAGDSLPAKAGSHTNPQGAARVQADTNPAGVASGFSRKDASGARMVCNSTAATAFRPFGEAQGRPEHSRGTAKAGSHKRLRVRTRPPSGARPCP